MPSIAGSSAGFPRTRRVRRRVEFTHVFDRGLRVQGRFLTLLMAPNAAGVSRLGIVASRKLGNSPSRNRAKRLIREVFRQTAHLPGLHVVDVVVIPRREIFQASFDSLEADFRAAFQRCADRLPVVRNG